MASFEIAVEKTLGHEGGYVKHPSDPGGETNFGISKRSYPHLDIKALTRAQAKEIYRRDFWNPLYSQIQNQDVASKLFDFGVNAGVTTAVRRLQEALGLIEAGPILVDGAFGPKTLAAVNAANGNPDRLAWEYRARIAAYYWRIAVDRPPSRAFLLGWMRRTLS